MHGHLEIVVDISLHIHILLRYIYYIHILYFLK